MNAFDKYRPKPENIRNACVAIFQDLKSSMTTYMLNSLTNTLVLDTLTHSRRQNRTITVDPDETPLSLVRDSLLRTFEQVMGTIASVPSDLDEIKNILRTNDPGNEADSRGMESPSKKRYAKKQKLICEVLLAASDV